jgi:hypothetical protein
MHYVCLIYANEASDTALTGFETQALVDECNAYSEQLARRGALVARMRLGDSSTATTLRVRNGRVSMTDGPFAETKEQLAGFYMIEADDMDAALRIATDIPPARVASVEVRQVMTLGARPARAATA